MNRIKAIFIIVMILSLGLFLNGSVHYAQQDSAISYNKGVIYEATFSIPKTLAELEANSYIIIDGVYNGVRVTDNDEALIGPTSISQINVEKIYKGNIDDKIISVLEPCKFEDGNYSNVDGYLPIKQGNKYRLYLNEINTEDGKVYKIVSGNFGKYNLSSSTALRPNPDVVNNFDQVSDLDMLTKSLETCERYNKIKSEITNETYEESSTQPELLENEKALYNFRIEPSTDASYYLDTQSTNLYTNHTNAYTNSIKKYEEIIASDISFSKANDSNNSIIELYSVNSPKEEWLGIAKISYTKSSGQYYTVSKAKVYLNQYNIETYKLTKGHVYEVALHELGHCFGLLHQDQIYVNQTIMGPYLAVKNTARTDLPTLDKNNIIYAYPRNNDWEKHWAKTQINDFINYGYVEGYPDGSFRPDNNITRAEYVVILNKVFGLTNASGKIFNDTQNHWAKEAIDIAVTNGVAAGVSTTEFRPDSYITREEAAKMVANYKGLRDTNYDKLNSYRDATKVSTWAKYAVEGILEVGYMNGYSDKTFRPQNNITRAEAIVTLSRIK